VEELILFIVKNIVSEPDKVVVKEAAEDFGKRVYELETSDTDRPYVIGKRGSTINAIRKLASIKDPRAIIKIKD
jgi:predicted RNA-binding protein YlqC (UPF0109 family)